MMIRWWHRLVVNSGVQGEVLRQVLAIGPVHFDSKLGIHWVKWQNFRYLEKAVTGWKFIRPGDE